MGMKTGAKLLIGHDITYQLLSMAEFWAALPTTCTGLRAEGDEIVTKVQGNANCGGCTSLRPTIAGLHNKIWNRVSVGAKAEPGTLPKLVEMLAAKRGYRPVPIEVYYRDEAGYVIKLSF